MKHVDDYRDPARVRTLAAAIRGEAKRPHYAFMEFCGGHTHALCRYGLEDLLPRNIRMIHGPGCPVCVLPIGRLEMAIELARRPEVILCTYGDMLRVPGKNQDSLMSARAQGADVRMIYSTAQAVALAEQNPNRQVVLFAIGFETTTPPTAVAVQAAAKRGLKNFSVLCNHVLTPAAVTAILTSDESVKLDGVVGPGHVSTVIGAESYEAVSREFNLPIAIAGFEPVDLLAGVLSLVRQVNTGVAQVDNGYARAVRAGGNAVAQEIMADVFAVRHSFEWRGLGAIPRSALRLADKYAALDAEKRFGLEEIIVPDHKACACADILRGQKRPTDCKVFGTACTPDRPLGACMVSSEGACAAHYQYGRFRDSLPLLEAAE
jgi:hydrogenase expression/formation protein HypD